MHCDGNKASGEHLATGGISRSGCGPRLLRNRRIMREMPSNCRQNVYGIMDLVRSLLAYFFCLIVLLAATSPQLPAQDLKYEGMKVINIRFDPPVQPLEGEELFEILPLKRGEPLRMPALRSSIERLFATGRYADIRVDVSPFDGG